MCCLVFLYCFYLYLFYFLSFWRINLYIYIYTVWYVTSCVSILIYLSATPVHFTRRYTETTMDELTVKQSTPNCSPGNLNFLKLNKEQLSLAISRTTNVRRAEKLRFHTKMQLHCIKIQDIKVWTHDCSMVPVPIITFSDPITTSFCQF